MSKQTAIKIENLSKQYQLGNIGTGTLSRDLNRTWAKILRNPDPYLKIGETNDRTTKGESNLVWALKDINFEVKQGEILGIIGKNGAGKSTLLKILSKVTGPTTGSIKAKGRIAALLEVGTGFHPELTGRENVFLNGAILGMTKWEIKSKLDEIVDFAGVERYLDTPVKRYSSGMMVRLGFAVAAHLEPEILVVDEVLAVGDAEFQKKAIGKMQDVSKNHGRTVLFVSHNMAAVQSLCNKIIVLKNGTISFEGDVKDGVRNYLSIDNLLNNKTGFTSINSDKNGFSFIDITLKNGHGTPASLYSYNESILVDIKYKISKPLSAFVLLFRITNQDGVVLFTSWDRDNNIKRNEELNTEYIAAIEIPSNLLKKDIYNITIAAHTPNVEVLNMHMNITSFEISELNYDINQNREGLIMPKLNWRINKLN